MASPFPTSKSTIPGEAGRIEIAAHVNEMQAPVAIAVVSHPHPLFGGTMDNKVTTTLARALFDAGAAAYRFNFRGVGGTEGAHDDGRGETADLIAVIQYARAAHPGAPLWLSGFSFGAAVTLAASEQIECNEMVIVAPGFSRMSHWQNLQDGGRAPESTLLIHGEKDETVPLLDSLNWARTRGIAVTVVPEADHFFHQRLHILRRIVGRWMAPCVLSTPRLN
ncbi:MAG: alpha/beta fold hydrolase [Usitatibacteraceae bacterium]